MIFGGIKGLNIFRPESVSLQDARLAVMVADVRISNTSFRDSASRRYITGWNGTVVSRLRLPYDKASLAFDFVALDYSAPDKISYAYFLEGWDNTWVQAGKVRTANYSRLREGEYVLRVKAANSQGDWGPETKLFIRVLPPWYRSWWAYCLYVAVVSGMVAGWSWYRRKQARMAYEILVAQMETRQEKELNEKKLSFFTNITHELRTPLTLIVNPVKELLGKAEDELKPDLNLVYRNANRLLTLVDQLMLFRTAESDLSKMHVSRFELHQLCRDTFECFSQLAHSRQIRYTFSAPDHPVAFTGDQRKMEIVLFNLISNAVKYTPSQGTIKVALTDTENGAVITVADTGCGIDEQLKSHLFEKYYRGKQQPSGRETGFGIGLYLVRQFVDLHGGELDVRATGIREPCLPSGCNRLSRMSTF